VGSETKAPLFQRAKAAPVAPQPRGPLLFQPAAALRLLHRRWRRGGPARDGRARGRPEPDPQPRAGGRRSDQLRSRGADLRHLGEGGHRDPSTPRTSATAAPSTTRSGSIRCAPAGGRPSPTPTCSPSRTAATTTTRTTCSCSGTPSPPGGADPEPSKGSRPPAMGLQSTPSAQTRSGTPGRRSHLRPDADPEPSKGSRPPAMGLQSTPSAQDALGDPGAAKPPASRR
jgi:hypothetical protein